MNSIFTAAFFSILRALDLQGGRSKRWTLKKVVYASLLMAFHSPRALTDRFEEARAAWVKMFPGAKRPGKSYQGFVKARRRIPGKVLRAIKRHLRDHHRRIAQDYWRRSGWEVFSVDGTRVEVPRTKANQKALGCAGRKKSGPQLSLTCLYHLGTGLPWAWQIGPGTESEQVHLRGMLDELPEGSLLVADAGFTGFELLTALLERKVNFLVRMGSNRKLLKGLEDVRVETHGEEVWFWPKKQQSKAPPLRLRLIRIEQPRRSPVCLVTNVLDRRALTDQQIRQFYRRRWSQEVFYRSFKRTLGHYQMRSGSPEEARRELDWAMMAYLLMGLLSVEALIQAGYDPWAWSPAASLRIIRRVLASHGRLGRARDLRVLLAKAVKDRYVRTGPKDAQNYPRKKTERPPGTPKIHEATEKEKACAKRIYENMKAA